MNGKDLLIDLGNISHKYYEEAETVTELNSEHKTIPFRKAVLIAAVIALLAVTITACAYAIQRIRINLVHHNVPVETEMIIPDIEYPEETVPVNVLTDCYPQTLPEGYSFRKSHKPYLPQYCVSEAKWKFHSFSYFNCASGR